MVTLTLALTTAVWMIVGMLILLRCASGLAQQIPVAAMSGIKKEESKEVTNSSTLLSVLQATAAPMGVAVFSSIVQIRGQHYIIWSGAASVRGDVFCAEDQEEQKSARG